MSKRRWRAPAVDEEMSTDESEQQPPSQQQQRAPRASRRAGLQLSQSTAAADSGGGPAGNALAVLLAGSRASVAADGARSGTGTAAVASGAGARAAKSHPRRGSRAALSQATAAAGSGGGASQQGAAAGAAAAQTLAASAAAAAKAATAAKAAAAAAGRGELWVERYAPASEADLVVHKKRVQEVREWLEEQRHRLGQPGVPRLLVVTGPPGCGKSAVLTTLAAAVGFDINEWRPASAVPWEEAEYAGIDRRSKLDEFSDFVVRSKMPHLSLHSSRSSGAGNGTSGRGGISGAAEDAAPMQQQQQQQQQHQSQQSQQPPLTAAMRVTQAAAAGRSSGRLLPPSLLPTLVVVDDLPHAAGPEQRRQIAEALGELAGGARFPVVVVATESSGKAQQEKGLSAAAGTYQGLHKELIAVLEAHRATTISFNPFTSLMIAKALTGILEKERRVLSPADVQAIAEQSNGDLHNAISTLQFVCTGIAAAPVPAPAPRSRGRGTKRKTVGSSSSAGAAGAGAGKGGGKDGESKVGGGESKVGFALRDSTLTLFHALGKLLYNKRLEGSAAAAALTASAAATSASQQLVISSSMPPLTQTQQAQHAQQPGAAAGSWLAALAAAAVPEQPLPLAAWAQRRPMDFDPEAVLAAAGLEAGSVAAFLHENLLNFIDEGAIEDVAGCLDQLSLADCLASGRRWGTDDQMMGDEEGASRTLLDALAASTAARGVCFSIAHPAPRRWQPLKAPALFLASKATAANRGELSRHTAATWAVAGAMGSLEPGGRLAAELLPYARAIAACCNNPPALQRLQPARWTRFWGGKLFEERQGGGSGWQQEQEEASAGMGGGGMGHVLDEDAIEESEDEDDW